VRGVQSASKASWTKELEDKVQELTYWIFLIPLREGLGFFPYFSWQVSPIFLYD